MPMTCIAVERLNAALHSESGFRDFRPGQLDAMLPVLHGRDVFVRQQGRVKAWQCFWCHCHTLLQQLE